MGMESNLEIEQELAAVIAQARASQEASAMCARSATGVRLEICGTLPPSWSGSLSLHCSAIGLNIESGLGCRISPSKWAARFELSSERPLDVHAFEFLRMARGSRSSATRSAAPHLESFELVRQPGRGLTAAVRGPDQPGFLASVLQRFALFGLHPDRFVLGSFRGHADDVFLLKTVGGTEPSPECAAALRSALTACLPAPTARAPGSV